jgi:hypothetical protein
MLLTRELPSNWKKFGNYFNLLQMLVEGDLFSPIKDLLVSVETVARLVNFMLNIRSPQRLRECFPVVPLMGNTMLSPEFAPVAETIAALIGVARLRPAPLLTEDSTGEAGFPIFTEKAEAALKHIFRKFAPAGGMTRRELIIYFRACTGSADPHLSNSERINDIFESPDYPLDAQGRLTPEAFLNFYRVAANENAEEVRKDLKAHNFDSQLNLRSEDSAVEEGSPASDDTLLMLQVAKVYKAHADMAGDYLPQYSRAVITIKDFTEFCLNSETVAYSAMGILAYACYEHLEASQTLLGGLVSLVERSQPEWRSQVVAIGQYVDAISAVLSIEDSFAEKRAFFHTL